MICSNCGTDNQNDEKFCKSCGKPIGDMATEKSKEKFKENTSVAMDKVKALPKNLILGIGGALVALIIIIILVSKSASTINLDKYVEYKFEGYDGYGRAIVSINWNDMEEKYAKKVKFTSKGKKEYGGFVSYVDAFDEFKSYVKISVDQTSNLSNGDEIKYSWKVDEDVSDIFTIKVKYSDGKEKVKNLEKVGTFDAFENLEVTFDGVAPSGNVRFNYNDPKNKLNTYDFTADKTDNLNNGDIVTITYNSNRCEDLAKQYGEVPETLEKQYTVNGLDKYITAISEIDTNALDSMKKQVEDSFNSYAATWSDLSKLVSLTYIGNYLLVPKTDMSNYNTNRLIMVYKAQYRTAFGSGDDTYDKVNDIFWYGSFNDLKLTSDGITIVNTNNYSTPKSDYVSYRIESGVSYEWWSNYSWNTSGYETLDDLYKNLVTQNVERFNHEDNVDISLAPETVND